MQTINNIKEYAEVTENGKNIILFSADWCGDCIFIKPFLPSIEKSFPEWNFYYVNRDDLIDLCKDLDIYGIPSFLAYKEGVVIGRFVSKDRKTSTQKEDFIRNLG